MLIKTILKDPIKVERIINSILKCTYISIAWDNKKCWFPVKNNDVSRTPRVCHVIYIFQSSLSNTTAPGFRF